jgi:hypothetical protein
VPRVGRWVNISLYATYKIRKALPKIKPLEARQRLQGPRQRFNAFHTQHVVPAQWHGILRHAAIRSHLGPLGPQSLGRVLGAWRLALSSGCSQAAPLPLSPLVIALCAVPGIFLRLGLNLSELICSFVNEQNPGSFCVGGHSLSTHKKGGNCSTRSIQND